MGRLARDHHRTLLTVLAALALVGGTYLVISRFIGADFGETLRRTDPRWLPICLAGEAAAYLGYIVGYREIARLDDGPLLDYRVVGEVVGIGFGADVLASAGAPAVDYWALTRAGVGRDEALARVLALNTFKFLIFALLAAGSGVIVLAGLGHGAPTEMAVAWIALTTFCIGAAMIVSRFHVATPQATERGRGLRGLEHLLAYFAREGVADTFAGLSYVGHLISRADRYPLVFLAFPLYWAGDIACLWAGVTAVGAHPDGPSLMLAYATGYVASVLPLPAGGSGSTEAGLGFALHASGIPLAQALLGVAVFRLFNFWLPLLPAAAMLPRVRRVDAELRGAASMGITAS